MRFLKLNNLFVYSLVFLICIEARAQTKVDRLIIITTDGFRWQELFAGIDSALATQEKYNQEDSLLLFKKYWHGNALERRKLLMPFFWNTISSKGQVYGNRHYGNKINTANPFRFSYPGYNEIFTGFPDTAINRNDFPANPHVNVLEFLNRDAAYKNNVVAFTAWNAFDRILNEQRSGMPVIAAFDTLKLSRTTERQKLINTMLADSYRPWGDAECLDVFAHYAAMEYLKTEKPKVLYLSYGETDEWAHAGQYRDYLNAAHQFDKWLKELWDFVQNDPLYKNRTAFFITTDHGRGVGDEWTKHGKDIQGAEEIWFAVVSPTLPAKGEVKSNMQLYQQQFAGSMTKLIGREFTADHFIAKDLFDVLK